MTSTILQAGEMMPNGELQQKTKVFTIPRNELFVYFDWDELSGCVIHDGRYWLIESFREIKSGEEYQVVLTRDEPCEHWG